MFSGIKPACNAILKCPDRLPESNVTMSSWITDRMANIIKEYAAFRFGFSELLAKTRNWKFEFLE